MPNLFIFSLISSNFRANVVCSGKHKPFSYELCHCARHFSLEKFRHGLGLGDIHHKCSYKVGAKKLVAVNKCKLFSGAKVERQNSSTATPHQNGEMKKQGQNGGK